MFQSITLLSSILILSCLTSCIYSSTKQEVTSDESKRVSIQFSSSKASNIFHAKIKIKDITKYKGLHREMHNVTIPFIFMRRHSVFDEIGYYNSNVALADINNDSIITLNEARNFWVPKTLKK